MTARVGIICAGDFNELPLLEFLGHLGAIGVECRLEVCGPDDNVTVDLVQSWRLGGVEVFVVACTSGNLASAVGGLTTAPMVRLPGADTTPRQIVETVDLCLRIVAMKHGEYADRLAVLADRAAKSMLLRRERLLENARTLGHPLQQSLPTAEEAEAWFTAPLRRLLATAGSIAVAYGHAALTPEHMLAAMIDTPSCAAHGVLLEGTVPLDVLAGHVSDAFPPETPGAAGRAAFSSESTTLLDIARQQARNAGHLLLGTPHLMRAMALMPETGAGRILGRAGLSTDTMDAILSSGKIREEAGASTAAQTLLHDASSMQKRLFGKTERGGPAIAMGCGTKAVPTEESEHAPQDSKTGRRKRGESKAAKGGSMAGGRKSARKVRDKPSVETVVDKADTAADTRPAANIVRCNPLEPQLSVVEMAVDRILEGRLVAFPTDTVYGVGADATNTRAVGRLYEIKGRPASKAVAVLIHSVKQLAHVARNIPGEVPRLLEEFWPGPLTLVFERHPACLAGVSSDATIGVRIPDHYLALSLLSMIGRPLATTSANLSGQPDSLTANEVGSQFGNAIDLILDGGEAPGKVTSTVLSVVERPFRILREGAVGRSVLEAALGHKLA